MSKAEPKGFKLYVVHITSGQYSQVAQLSGGISSVSSHLQNSTRSRTCHPLKVRLEEHRKAVVRSKIEKSSMADHI